MTMSDDKVFPTLLSSSLSGTFFKVARTYFSHLSFWHLKCFSSFCCESEKVEDARDEGSLSQLLCRWEIEEIYYGISDVESLFEFKMKFVFYTS